MTLRREVSVGRLALVSLATIPASDQHILSGTKARPLPPPSLARRPSSDVQNLQLRFGMTTVSTEPQILRAKCRRTRLVEGV